MKILIEDKSTCLEVERIGNNKFDLSAQDTEGNLIELSVNRLEIIHFIHGLKALLKES